MRANNVARMFTVLALIAAALFGFWTRWQSAQVNSLRAPASRSALTGLQLNDGAVVEEVVSELGDERVRLRLAQCPDPAFLFPLRIEWVSTAESLDRSFAGSGYKTFDVYQGKIQPEFTRVNLIYKYVLARIAAMGSAEFPASGRFYVQAYIGAHCHVDQSALVDWARAVLAYWI
jgi:hypothetical protein